MKNRLRLVLLTLILLIIPQVSSARQKVIIPTDASINDNVYDNRYFTFTVKIPGNWHVVSNQEQKQAFDQGKESFTAGKTKIAAGADADRVFQLLNVCRTKPGTDLNLNSSFVIVAEPVIALSKRQADTPEKYLKSIRKSMEESLIPVSFPRDIYRRDVGGVSFSVMEVNIRFGNVSASQTVYAAVRKKYMLVLALTHSGKEDEGVLKEMLGSIVFK